jgi:hypothetical protein
VCPGVSLTHGHAQAGEKAVCHHGEYSPRGSRRSLIRLLLARNQRRRPRAGAGAALLGYTFYSNVVPVPPAPARWFPYIVLAWVLVGIVMAVSRPAVMRRIYTELAEPETEPSGTAGTGELQPGEASPGPG